MLELETLEQAISELPLYMYGFFKPEELEFNPRIRWICEHECPMYGTTWACPPGVGTVEQCEQHCRSYTDCLMISTIAEVEDIADISQTLATRPAHEEITNQAADALRSFGINPFVLSTEACTLCSRCAIADGEPCRFPDRMHPCVESQGINVVPVLERFGLEFQFGQNVVTWVSLLLFSREDV